MTKEHIKKTRTKKAIIEAFQYLMTIMPFDKITIQNISDIAEINRHSFYNYFTDKYDLLYDIVKQMLIIEYDTSSEKSLGQQTIDKVPAIMKSFEENREFFKSAFVDDNQKSFNNFFQNLIFNLFTSILNSDNNIQNSKIDSFIKSQARFYVAGYSQLLIYWLYNEPDKSAAVMSDEIIKILKSTYNNLGE